MLVAKDRCTAMSNPGTPSQERRSRGEPQKANMRRRVAAFLAITILLSFTWPPVPSVPATKSSCTCGCVANGRACRCCCASRAPLPAGIRIQARLADSGHRCPCTAGVQLPVFKLHAIVNDGPFVTASLGESRTPCSPETLPLDSGRYILRDRAPPA